MIIVNIANIIIGPAACIRDNSARIIFLRPTRKPFGVILAPALIEDDPLDHRWIIVKVIDHPLLLSFPLSGTFFGDIGVEFPAANEILPDHEAKPVAPVVPPPRMDLDMDANHVAADIS